MPNNPISLEELCRLGEKFYAEHKESMEKDLMGQFAVVDVTVNEYEADPDRLVAIEKARKRFGDKLFYIIQFDGTQRANPHFSSKTYAWHF